MSKSWPPSPSVEDESASRAREHGSDTSDSEPDHGEAPTGSQGAVDQYPIIQDLHARDEPHRLQEKRHPKQTGYTAPNNAQTHPQESSARSQKVNEEKRYLFVPGPTTDATVRQHQSLKPRSKSTTRIDGDETPRGRPNIARINTDLGSNELRSMATGQRLAPSPYAYRPSTTAAQIPVEGRSKASMLSPEAAAIPRQLDSGVRRSRSAHPGRTNVAIESSDSDNKSSQRRDRSRSRARPKEAPKEAHFSADERYTSGRSERHRSRHRRSEQNPAREKSPPNKNHRSAHGNITPPQTPSLPRESPYVFAAEESDRRRRDKSRARQVDRRYSKESPYTSAAEDSYKRWSGDERSIGISSRRGSMKRPDIPGIDLGDSRTAGRFNPSTPTSARNPKAQEDYFQQAFEANQKKQTRYGSSNSANPSPFSSPPVSPPRTPRGERKVRDYFEVASPLSVPPKQRSRSLSIDENPIKPLTSLLSAAIGGSLAAKVLPAVSRSSTASLEAPSSGSPSSLPSGQRSRKPSPVYEDPRPMSRTTSTTSREEVHGPRMSTPAGQHDRPVSRAGSVASREENIPSRTSTYPPQSDRPVSRAGSVNESYFARANAFALHDERPNSRNGSNPLGLMTPHPPPAQRASSYSSSYDQSRPRPSSRRTYSTNGAVVMPASSQHVHPPSNLSHSYTSPVSTDNVPTISSPNEAKTISFPPCPRQSPVTGFNHWYTIQGMQNFDICNTCMQVLGASSFRDYCIPSPYRPPTVAVACSLGRPWIRIAVARSLKDGTANINSLQNLNWLPPDVWPCPGKSSAVRQWYHVTDPSTKMPISNFDVCTACVRSVELIFPELRQEKFLQRPLDKLIQERVCNLNSSSKHFYNIVNELDRLASYSRKKDYRSKDVTDFAELVKGKMRYRECQKDSMLATPLWHFMTALPELTICEECYEEVVWPLKDKPLAREIQMTLQKVPTYRPDHHIAGVSCQLYSERMRSVFRDAVAGNDFETLKHEAQMRFSVEHRLQEKQRLLAQDQKAGIDRRADMERNSAIWKSYE